MEASKVILAWPPEALSAVTLTCTSNVLPLSTDLLSMVMALALAAANGMAATREAVRMLMATSPLRPFFKIDEFN